MKPGRQLILMILLSGSTFLLPDTAFSQLRMYEFEQIDSLQKTEKRNVVVFIHTDWCKYCQAMLNITFKDASIINKLNNHFYFTELDAEEKRDITFGNKTFKYKPTGANTGIHELAVQLGSIDNTVAYPALCFLNFENEIIFQYNQFINAKDLNIILTRLQ
jgi:thioredoxin-related protein